MRSWEHALVMMVDDESMLTDVIQCHLDEAGYTEFIACNHPLTALPLIRQRRPDVLLLDLMMPGLSGFDILAAVRADPELRYTPVIVLTASSDPANKLRALEMGATEFLAKPVDASELVLRMRNTLAFKHYQDRLAYMDAVTGLPNRDRFLQLLTEAMAWGKAQAQCTGLLHISCDQLKATRETLGQRAADQVLNQVGQRLVEAAEQAQHKGSTSGEAPSIARIGDQDFALLLPDLHDANQAALIAHDIIQSLAQPLQYNEHTIFLKPGIGIALAPSDSNEPDDLLNCAHLSCVKAQNARNATRYEFFSEQLTARSRERFTLSHELRRALEQQELRLYYQPKVSLQTGLIVGAEALVRWQHPQHGLLLPGRFIDIAEEADLIGPLGDWVACAAIQQIAQWREQGLHEIKVSINASRPQFEDGSLCPRLAQLMHDAGVPAEQVIVELTESLLIQDAERALQQMSDLRQLGVSLSIDDFGTGYSSLSYLRRFPANELKIDRGFIIDLHGNPKDQAIVQAVVTLGHNLGMSVVAEGIEDAQQMRLLQEMGCDIFQGFLFSKAVPAEAFETLLRGNSAQALVKPPHTP
jgi:diguanylate cyclase (GGDEF)-like protein